MTVNIISTLTIKISEHAGSYYIEASGLRTTIKPLPFAWSPAQDDLETIDLLHSDPTKVSEEELITLGQTLYKSVFVPQILLVYYQSNKKLKSGDGIRIRLVIETSKLGNIPWEVMHDGQDFVSLYSEYPIVRGMREAFHVRQTPVSGSIRILYVWSDPSDLPALDLSLPADEIKKLLGKNKRISFDVLSHATLISLRKSLLSTYHVICFAGHGTENYILLEKETGKEKHEELSAKELARELEGRPIQLVFLAACQTAGKPLEDLAGFAQTLAIETQIPAIVAMQYEISDDQANLFTARYLEIIANFRPLDVALAEARKTLLKEHNILRDVFSPVIYLQSKTSNLFQHTRNWLTIGIALLAIITTILAIWLGSQVESSYLKAEKANTTAQAEASANATAQVQANEQRSLARSEQLAAQALTQLDKKLDLGLLLSVEAFKKSHTLQTKRALYLAWQHNPKLKQYLQGYTYPIESVAWSRNDQLATASNDNDDDGLSKHTIVIWDLQSGKPAQILYPANSTTSLAWSADGHLASGSSDSTITIWDLSTGKPAQILHGHTGKIIGLEWSDDGQLASTATDDTIFIWNSQSGKPTHILFVLDVMQEYLNKSFESFAHVGEIAWSKDGQFASVITGSSPDLIVIWDLQTGKPAQILPNVFWYGQGDTRDMLSYDAAGDIAWSSDGRLASVIKDGFTDSIVIWDLQNNEPAQILPNALWDIQHSETSQILRVTTPIDAITWSNDGVLASISNYQSGLAYYTVAIWDLQSGQPAQILQEHTDRIASIAWSDKGLLASGSLDKTVIVWDLQSTYPEQILHGTNNNGKNFFESVAWSSDGQLASGSFDNTVIVWDLQNNKPIQVLNGHTGSVNDVAWSRDGRLASGGGPFDRTVIIWDLQNGRPAQVLKGHNEGVGVASLDWSDDGQLASVEDDGSIIVWNLQSGQLIQKITVASTTIAWSHDGRLAEGSAYGGDITIWDLQSGKHVQDLNGPTSWINSVAWSIEDHLASGSEDGTVIVWDLQSSKPAQLLRGHTSAVTSVAWSSDGRLASGARDGTVIIWDLQSGQPAQVLQGHTDDVTSIAWSSDGRLASASGDNTIIIWEGNPDVWAEQSCQRAGRNLTKEEWNSYFPAESYRETCANLPSIQISSTPDQNSEPTSTPEASFGGVSLWELMNLGKLVFAALCCFGVISGIIFATILIFRAARIKK